MESSIAVTINGKRVTLPCPSVSTTLLDALRDLGLTGAKEGCAEGECGACMVAMVSPDGPNASAYRPVNSCLVLLPAAHGQEFVTVEGLTENGALSSAQTCLAEAGGSQCGYCTPGFAVSLFTEQYRKSRTGPCDPHAMGGNLCRCTGYRPIRDAALAVSTAPAGPLRDRLAQPAPELQALELNTPGTRFYRPTTVADCIAAAQNNPGARWIAGGTDLAVESNLKFRRWPCLISLEAVAELRVFSESESAVVIGAGLSLNEIEAQWKSPPEAWHEWSFLFSSPSLRNRATLGGSLGTASPIGDSAPLLMALNATLHVAGPAGRRIVPLSSFFTSYRETALGDWELIEAVEIPKPFPQHLRFYKASKRRLDDISTVAAAFAINLDPARKVQDARLAFGGVAATPLRVIEAEAELVGKPWAEPAVHSAAQVLGNTLHPMSDHRGSAEYRLEMAQRLIEKFYWEFHP